MLTFKTIQLLVLGLNFSANGLSTYLSYKISRIPEVQTGIWELWAFFFLSRFFSFSVSVFFLVKLDIARSLFGTYITIAAWIYGATFSLIALAAVAMTYKSLKQKFPWTK